MGAQRYAQLMSERDVFLTRARACAKLTLPMVIRQDGADSSTSYDTPYQSVGARGVTNLSSNMVLSLFPAGTPFFRLLVSKTDFAQFGADSDRIMGEVEAELSDIERTVLEEIESLNLRSTLFEVIKNLLIAGSSLIYVQPDGNIRNYTLEDFVCHRDVSGNITDIIVKETISGTVAKSLDIKIDLPSDDKGARSVDKDIELYTCVRLEDDGTYYEYQEVRGKILKDTESYYEKDKLPWLPLRMTKNTGESYGRSYVETVIGDLKSLELLSKSVVESAAIAAKTLFFVEPASITNIADVANAGNGAVVPGRAADVSELTSQKAASLNLVMGAIQQYENRLSYAFNLLEATIPSPGAKTATEINAIVSSLEKVLAGAYAMLASEGMQPMVSLVINRLQESNTITTIPDEVKLIISTGLAALGRNTDLERLQTFFSLAMGANPEVANGLIDWDKAMRLLETSTGVDILKSKETLEQEMQAQQAAMQEQAKQAQQQQGLDQAGQMADLITKLPQQEEQPQL